MRAHKGFTLLEIVVTLAILAISFGLTVGVVAALTNLQSSAADEESIDYQLRTVDNITNEYVNFVSIKGFEFNCASSNSSKTVFTYESSDFTLGFENRSLYIRNNYDGDIEYFKKTKGVYLENIDNITFTYDSSLAMLITDVEYGTSTLRYSYVVRTLQ